MSDPADQTRVHAALTLAVALLKAFRSLEMLLTGVSLIGIVGLFFSHETNIRWLGLGVFLTGLAGLYVAFRIRVDAILFAQWETLDPAALDQVLQTKRAQFEPGRTLESRLSGTYCLLKLGVGLTVFQCALLVAMAVLAAA